MLITTMHTLHLNIRTANGEFQLAKDFLEASSKAMSVEIHKLESLPLPDGEDPAFRNTSIQIRSCDEDRLENYWLALEKALALIGVEATSP